MTAAGNPPPRPLVGVYPGTFDPPTVAHLAIAEAAWRQGGLARVDLVLSRRPLGKAAADDARLRARLAALGAAASTRPWLGVRVTDAQLLAELAAGYDVLVLGADKWAQVVDPAWYGSVAARDAAVASLPRVLVAPRPPHPLPAGLTVLHLPAAHGAVSSSAVRAGRWEWMAPEAAAVDRRTGAWGAPAGPPPPDADRPGRGVRVAGPEGG